MKTKLFLPVLLCLVLAACAGSAATSAIPTIVLGGNPATAAALTSSNENGGVSASGFLVADQQAQMAFSLGGIVTQVNVAVADKVQAGQVLVQLDDFAQQIALQQAKLALQEFSSPEAVANAKLAVTSAQEDVINAQYALNNQQYWQNDQLIQDQYSNVVIAKANLDKAQNAYDKAKVGEYINNSGEAALYQALYNAQKAYDNAQYYFSLYSQKPTQRQLDEVQATYDLANVRLTNAQNYLAALNGGVVPQDASGSAWQALQLAHLAVQSAEDSLQATQLKAPFVGEIASITVSKGDFVSPGQIILVISDNGHLHVETSDLSERDVTSVSLGQTATVSIKALNQEVPAKVTAISPVAQTLGGDVVYPVSLSLEQLPSGAMVGMSVDVQFNPNP